MLMQAKDAINHVALARTLERPSVFHLIDAFPKAFSEYTYASRLIEGLSAVLESGPATKPVWLTKTLIDGE
jgi:hypothetical protein